MAVGILLRVAPLALLAPTALIGCSKSKKAPPPDDEPTQIVVLGAKGESVDAVADRFYNQRCGLCHGATGKGDGPSATFLKPKPRDFSDPAWQASITDDAIKKITLEGGVAVGKSPAMPPNAELRGHDDVVAALVKRVRAAGHF